MFCGHEPMAGEVLIGSRATSLITTLDSLGNGCVVSTFETRPSLRFAECIMEGFLKFLPVIFSFNGVSTNGMLVRVGEIWSLRGIHYNERNMKGLLFLVERS